MVRNLIKRESLKRASKKKAADDVLRWGRDRLIGDSIHGLIRNYAAKKKMKIGGGRTGGKSVRGVSFGRRRQIHHQFRTMAHGILMSPNPSEKKGGGKRKTTGKRRMGGCHHKDATL